MCGASIYRAAIFHEDVPSAWVYSNFCLLYFQSCKTISQEVQVFRRVYTVRKSASQSQMDKSDGWSSAASMFVRVLRTATVIYVIFFLPRTYLPSATRDSRDLMKQRPEANDLGGIDPIQWNIFPGCSQCLCSQEKGLVDCSGKMMSGRLPGTGSLPRNDVQIL